MIWCPGSKQTATGFKESNVLLSWASPPEPHSWNPSMYLSSIWKQQAGCSHSRSFKQSSCMRFAVSFCIPVTFENTDHVTAFCRFGWRLPSPPFQPGIHEGLETLRSLTGDHVGHKEPGDFPWRRPRCFQGSYRGSWLETFFCKSHGQWIQTLAVSGQCSHDLLHGGELHQRQRASVGIAERFFSGQDAQESELFPAEETGGDLAKVWFWFRPTTVQRTLL